MNITARWRRDSPDPKPARRAAKVVVGMKIRRAERPVPVRLRPPAPVTTSLPYDEKLLLRQIKLEPRFRPSA
ncbi:MAG: hypothetical protein ACKOEW_07445 [Methylocystis sp.]